MSGGIPARVRRVFGKGLGKPRRVTCLVYFPNITLAMV